MRADLLKETPQGVVVLQQAGINFMTYQYLPHDAPVQSTVGRTQPDSSKPFYNPENVKFWMFDYGF